MGDVDRILEIVRGTYLTSPSNSFPRFTRRRRRRALVLEAAGKPIEVQLESANGMCPLRIENDRCAESRNGDTPEDVAKTVLEWLA
jgi:hypothetical protein